MPQCAVNPPSTTYAAPVTYDASSEARKSATFATSSGLPQRPVGIRARMALLRQEPATFELVLDHDFGWDDGLICGGKVLGVILPNVQEAGEKFWSELAE